MKRGLPPSNCAQCGADIPPRALACPECGADERTGWAETSIYDGLDLPESDTEGASDRWAKRERPGLSLMWKTIGGILILALIIASILWSA